MGTDVERTVDHRAVLDATESAVVVTDRDGIIVFANATAAAMAGRPPAALIGTRYDDARWHVRDRDGRALRGDQMPVGRALAGEPFSEAELLVETPEGTMAMMTSARPLLDADGEVALVVTTTVDVTSVAAIEKDLAASRARLAAIFEHALEGIVLADDDRRYVAANPAAASMLGMTVDELVGRSITDVYVGAVDPDELLAEFSPLDFDVESDTNFRAFVDAGTFTEESVLRRADGSELVIEGRAVANVEPGLHLSVWRDATDRRRMLRDLARSRARLGSLVEGTSYGLMLCDQDGVVVVANPTAVRVLGARTISGRALAEVLGEVGVETTVADLLARPRGTGTEVTLRLTTGASVTFRATAVGTSHETVIGLEDVTARERAEEAMLVALQREHDAAAEQARVNDLKDTFMSAVSHELRTPLTAIAGLAMTLRRLDDSMGDEDRLRILDRLIANTDRLGGLLDDLLDLNRLHRGASLVRRTPVGLVELVQQLVGSLDLGHNQVALDLADVTVEVDRPKVERIIENLVANAARHTPDGTHVTIRAAPVGGMLVIEVEDDGPGIPEELRDSAFEMFVKGTSGPATSAGTGVGLALVREFSRALGGDAELVAPCDSGTRVRVTVPLSGPDDVEDGSADTA